MRKNRFFLSSLVLIVFSLGCQNNPSTPSDEAVKSDTTVKSMDGFVSSETDFVITPTKRPDMHVVAKVFNNVKPESLKTLFIGAAAELNQVIADSNRIITGPIMAIYDELPMPGVAQTIVVGIPINKPIKSNKFGFIDLKAGRFHKAKTMAGLGESAPFWTRVAERLKSSGYNIEPPFIEYPSDTRTGEMTSVVTNSNLLLPERKP